MRATTAHMPCTLATLLLHACCRSHLVESHEILHSPSGFRIKRLMQVCRRHSRRLCVAGCVACGTGAPACAGLLRCASGHARICRKVPAGQKLRCHVLKVCSITESEHAQVADAWLLLLSMTDAWSYISFWTVKPPLLSTPMPTLRLALHIGDRPMLAKHSVSCAQPSAKKAQKRAAWDVE